MTTVVGVHHLVGAAEVADMLSVSRQRVYQLAARPDFPAPVVTLHSGRIWEREAVARWMQEYRPEDMEP